MSAQRRIYGEDTITPLVQTHLDDVDIIIKNSIEPFFNLQKDLQFEDLELIIPCQNINDIELRNWMGDPHIEPFDEAIMSLAKLERNFRKAIRRLHWKTVLLCLRRRIPQDVVGVIFKYLK